MATTVYMFGTNLLHLFEVDPTPNKIVSVRFSLQIGHRIHKHTSSGYGRSLLKEEIVPQIPYSPRAFRVHILIQFWILKRLYNLLSFII